MTIKINDQIFTAESSNKEIIAALKQCSSPYQAEFVKLTKPSINYTESLGTSYNVYDTYKTEGDKTKRRAILKKFVVDHYRPISEFIKDLLRETHCLIKTHVTIDPSEYESDLKKARDSGDFEEEWFCTLILFIHAQTKNNFEERDKYFTDFYGLLSAPKQDKTAQIICEGDYGVSFDTPMGTYNLQQCSALIIRNPVTGKTMLIHVHVRITMEEIVNTIKLHFPEYPLAKLDVYVSGSRQEDKDSDIVINTIVSALKQFNNIEIKHADVLKKESVTPPTICIDPKTGNLSYAMPRKEGKFFTERSIKAYNHNILEKSFEENIESPSSKHFFDNFVKNYQFNNDTYTQNFHLPNYLLKYIHIKKIHTQNFEFFAKSFLQKQNDTLTLTIENTYLHLQDQFIEFIKNRKDIKKIIFPNDITNIKFILDLIAVRKDLSMQINSREFNDMRFLLDNNNLSICLNAATKDFLDLLGMLQFEYLMKSPLTEPLSELKISRNLIKSKSDYFIKFFNDNSKFLINIDMPSLDINNEKFAELLETISKLEHLEQLNIGGSRLDDKSTAVLIELIQNTKTLIALDISYIMLSEENAKKLLDTIAKNNTIQLLDVSGMTVDGLLVSTCLFVPIIEKNSSVKVMRARYFQFNSTEFLDAMKHNKSIEILDVLYSKIKSDNIVKMREANNRTIETRYNLKDAGIFFNDDMLMIRSKAKKEQVSSPSQGLENPVASTMETSKTVVDIV